MKTNKLLLVGVLVLASYPIFGANGLNKMVERKAEKQTTMLSAQLELSKKQTAKVQQINEKYALKEANLVAQKMEIIQLMGYNSPRVNKVFMETLKAYNNARTESIKSVLKEDQLIAFDELKPATINRRPAEQNWSPVRRDFSRNASQRI